MSSETTNYDVRGRRDVPTPERLKNFLQEIEEVSKRHNLSINATRCDGFIVSDFNPSDISMLKECLFLFDKDETKENKCKSNAQNNNT